MSLGRGLLRECKFGSHQHIILCTVMKLDEFTEGVNINRREEVQVLSCDTEIFKGQGNKWLEVGVAKLVNRME